MRTVNVHAAKTGLSGLLEAVERGEEIIIARAGKPIAKLVAFAAPTRRRPLGLLRGKMWADPELERSFYEGDPRFPSALDETLAAGGRDKQPLTDE